MRISDWSSDVCSSDLKHLGMEGMRAMLHELAKVGFVPIAEDSDPRAKLLSEKNIVGTVRAGSVTIGIPRDLWKGNDNGLVPASQSTRLLIARPLHRLKPDSSE